MSRTLDIRLTVDVSLMDHVRDGLQRTHSRAVPEDLILNLLTGVLDGSDLPIAAKKNGERGILVSYHLRSFSAPIF